MTRFTTPFGLVLALTAVAMGLSCSQQHSTPVQESALIGKWQQIGNPGVSITFLKDGTFSADAAGRRVMGGKYQLINGDRIILDLDASSPKVGAVTNAVSVPGGELRITPADGKTERYKRVE
jgi:hypothetical protein